LLGAQMWIPPPPPPTLLACWRVGPVTLTLLWDVGQFCSGEGLALREQKVVIPLVVCGENRLKGQAGNSKASQQ
jgi:hypothetical protein